MAWPLLSIQTKGEDLGVVQHSLDVDAGKGRGAMQEKPHPCSLLVGAISLRKILWFTLSCFPVREKSYSLQT